MFSASTVCAELQRCPPGAYNADDAHAQAKDKKSKDRSALIAAKIHGVSMQGVYNRFDKDPKGNCAKLALLAVMIGNPLPGKKFFRHGGAGAYRKRHKARTPFCRGDYATIHERPPGVAKRRRFGHWEVDLIVSGYGDAALSLVEMKSHTLILEKPQSR